MDSNKINVVTDPLLAEKQGNDNVKFNYIKHAIDVLQEYSTLKNEESINNEKIKEYKDVSYLLFLKYIMDEIQWVTMYNSGLFANVKFDKLLKEENWMVNNGLSR